MREKHKIFWFLGCGIFLIAGSVSGETPLPPLEFADVVEDVRQGAGLDRVIHPDLPVYHFHLTGNCEHSCIDRIDISRGNDPAIVQTLNIVEAGGMEPPLKGSDYFRTEDFNFDGYGDLMLQSWWGATGNTGFLIWIFDPATKEFLFNKELSEVSNPDPLPDTQEIATTSVGGMAGQIHYFGRYRWINGKLTMVWEEHQDWLPEEKCFLKVLRQRQGEDMVKVKEERICSGWFY